MAKNASSEHCSVEMGIMPSVGKRKCFKTMEISCHISRTQGIAWIVFSLCGWEPRIQRNWKKKERVEATVSTILSLSIWTLEWLIRDGWDMALIMVVITVAGDGYSLIQPRPYVLLVLAQVRILSTPGPNWAQNSQDNLRSTPSFSIRPRQGWSWCRLICIVPLWQAHEAVKEYVHCSVWQNFCLCSRFKLEGGSSK